MSPTKDVKAKAKRWVNDFLHGRPEAEDKKSDSNRNASTRSSPHADVNVLAQSIRGISLQENGLEPHFVGGFNPDLVNNIVSRDTINAGPGPPPLPPKDLLSVAGLQGNYSRTMRYALLGELSRETKSYQEPDISAKPAPTTKQRTVSAPPSSLSNDLANSTAERKERRASLAASPRQRIQQKTQCAAFTKAGKQCTRQVKLKASLQESDDDSEPTPRYCFQHIKEINQSTGFYARRNGVWVDYENWIPGHLQPETQAALRAEMEKARSGKDVPGYIYTFEIREPDSETIKLKVGRATNHVRRLDQWEKQCGSKEQIRLGIYPEPDGGESSNLRGLQEIDLTKTAAWCHRLERLIHLELTDIVETKVYLDHAWPNPGTHNNGSKTTQKSRIDDHKKACSDCGCVHKEIFEFERIKKGRYKGKEFELIVKPIIEKWGGFVDDFV